MGGVNEIEDRNSEDADAAGLLRRVALRECQAMEQFYGLYQEAVYRLALVRLGEPGPAAHVLQDLMLQIWGSTHAWRPGRRPRLWILQLTARATRTEAAEADDIRLDPSSQAIAPLAAQAGRMGNLHSALRDLPERYRTLLHLAYFERLCDADIAQILEMPQAAVTRYRRQGRDALCSLLGGNTQTDARARDLFLDAWMRRELRTAPDPSPCDFGLDRLKVQMRVVDRQRRRRRLVRRWLQRPLGRVRRWAGLAVAARRMAALG
jgi:RNA polymerase sigma-70 factor, ECF subfamily